MTDRDDAETTNVTPIRTRNQPENVTKRKPARGEVRVLLPDEPPTLTPAAARALLRLVQNAAAASEEVQVEQYDDKEAA